MIHSYKLGKYNIILDTCSGSVHSVDDIAYDIIELFKDKNREEISDFIIEKYPSEITREEIFECISDIEELEKDGRLFTKDIYADSIFDFTDKKDVIKALCLHVAHTCNLTCEYCFAAQGNFHGARALMSFDVGRQAIDFLIANSGSRHNLEVDFFGGEPLMNFEVVKQITAYARETEKKYGKNIRFTLTTNGVLINDDVIDFVNKEMSNVVLSLDGRKHIHDRLRKTRTGEGSYDIILPKFKKIVEERGGKNYYIRGTFTKENLDFTEDILHMADLGFKELSMEPVVTAPGDKYALSQEDLPELFRQYEKLAFEMVDRRKKGVGFNFYHYMIDLANGPCIHKRITGCGAGSEYMAVTPWGELYPCHQFVGEESYCLGDVWNGLKAPELRSKFKNCNAYSRSECRDCWARLYCSGGCAANAYHATGDIGGVYEYGCKLFKKRIECAIMMEVARNDDEKKVGG